MYKLFRNNNIYICIIHIMPKQPKTFNINKENPNIVFNYEYKGDVNKENITNFSVFFKKETKNTVRITFINENWVNLRTRYTETNCDAAIYEHMLVGINVKTQKEIINNKHYINLENNYKIKFENNLVYLINNELNINSLLIGGVYE